jgi:hypothetical protein
MTFRQLAEEYEKTKLVPAKYSNGVKVSGKRSIASAVCPSVYLRQAASQIL